MVLGHLVYFVWLVDAEQIVRVDRARGSGSLPCVHCWDQQHEGRDDEGLLATRINLLAILVRRNEVLLLCTEAILTTAEAACCNGFRREFLAKSVDCSGLVLGRRSSVFCRSKRCGKVAARVGTTKGSIVGGVERKIWSAACCAANPRSMSPGGSSLARSMNCTNFDLGCGTRRPSTASPRSMSPGESSLAKSVKRSSLVLGTTIKRRQPSIERPFVQMCKDCFEDSAVCVGSKVSKVNWASF